MNCEQPRGSDGGSDGSFQELHYRLISLKVQTPCGLIMNNSGSFEASTHTHEKDGLENVFHLFYFFHRKHDIQRAGVATFSIFNIDNEYEEPWLQMIWRIPHSVGGVDIHLLCSATLIRLVFISNNSKHNELQFVCQLVLLLSFYVFSLCCEIWI